MGWPSITKLTCAWSPNGWKNPLASAAVPPMLLLMMPLKPDAGSNEGSFMNAAEFASVCTEGSVSMRASEAPTSSVVVTSAILESEAQIDWTWASDLNWLSFCGEPWRGDPDLIHVLGNV